MVDGSDPFRALLPEILGQPAHVGAKSPILNWYLLVVNTNRKSTTRFPIILRWSSYVAPKPRKRGSKPQNCRFLSNIALRSKKVCYKVSLCENSQRQRCKAFIGLTNRAKMIGGDVSFYLKFWVKVTALERNRRFSIMTIANTQRCR